MLGLSGNRTSVVENDGSEIHYSYDNLYRLIEETRTGTDAYSISYIYDEVGNRLSMTKNAETTVYDYNINDQLTIETTPEGITSYEYDNNGNTIRKTAPAGITDYIYNYNNKLITADIGGNVTSYVYSADGNRVSKTDYYGTTNYLVDTNNSTGYAQVLEELDTDNNCMVYYTYGDDLISQSQGSLKNYYHYDGHGSVRALTNAPAMVTDTYVYDAFGNEIASTGNTPNNYKYCGEQYDPNVGFYYLRARYYNPSVGRFTTMDAFSGVGSNPFSLHKYVYCNNQPVTRIDPSGYTSLPEIMATMAVSTKIQLMYSTAVFTLGSQALERAISSFTLFNIRNRSRKNENATIVMHGVAFHEYGWSRDFIDNIARKATNQDVYEFTWSGFALSLRVPTLSANRIAVRSLKEGLSELRKKGYKTINIIAHSWGTVVSRDALNEGVGHIGLWATMGSPLPRNTNRPGNLGRWINVFSMDDPIVKNADKFYSLVGGALFKKEAGIEQLKITTESDHHSAYWSNANTISTISEILSGQEGGN